MRSTMRFLTIFMIVSMMLFAGASVSLACTGVYVGPEASSDGTTIIARCNDISGVNPSRVNVVPRVENEPGRTMPVNMAGTVTAEIPETTFKYTETPFMQSMYMTGEGGQRDSSACINEYGVMMSMSVTAFSNNAAMKADPWVENGLVEDAANDLVICQSRTAREAVEVLFSIIDKYGSAETNIAMIADQKEAWYVEMYTGHQYAAVKLPADKVSVFGNEFTMEYLSDYAESIVSEDLLKLPEDKGFAVYGKGRKHQNELNLFDTYSGDDITISYSHMRTWIGHNILAPSVYHEDYDKDERYPLCFEPDRKVSMEEVASLMRNRYDGTEYDPDTTGRYDMRVIGTEKSSSTHAMQLYPDLPASMAGVTWISIGPLIYGLFVPVSNASASISEAYNLDQPAEDAGKFDTGKYPYYAFKALNTMCTGPENAEIYGKPVRDYWEKAEKGMFGSMPRILQSAEGLDPESASEYISDYCIGKQKQAFSDAKALLNDVMWEQSNNSDSLQMGRNPETHEILKTRRVLEPMQVELDPSAYSEVPDPPEAGAASGKENGESSFLHSGRFMMILVLAALALILIAVVLAKKK